MVLLQRIITQVTVLIPAHILLTARGQSVQSQPQSCGHGIIDEVIQYFYLSVLHLMCSAEPAQTQMIDKVILAGSSSGMV